MAIKRLSIEEFLALAAAHPVLDVRSPGEYAHAHIPGAHNLPLFSDEERKIVGTAYKQETREKAIKIGLKYFGGRMVQMVEATEQLFSAASSSTASRKVLVHCWRGGMRSAGVAWLLDLYGFSVYTLAGGYKAYRNWVLQQFTKEYNVRIVGGYTGSAKTHTLHALAKLGEHIIDLEAIASHKGSAFGNIGMPPQPTQEMYENRLATALAAHQNKPGVIWMEDESQRIGAVNTPSELFRHLRGKPVYFLDIPVAERLEHIVAEYGKLDQERMVNAIIRIRKRLGGLETKNAVNHLIEGNTKACFEILLRYYDKWYGKSMQLRDNWEQLIQKIPSHTCDAATNAALLRSVSQKESVSVHG